MALITQRSQDTVTVLAYRWKTWKAEAIVRVALGISAVQGEMTNVRCPSAIRSAIAISSAIVR